MSEREWQPGASDAGAPADERRADDAAVGRGAGDDANNVEGVQGAQGGRTDQVERERPERSERAEGVFGRERDEERGEVF